MAELLQRITIERGGEPLAFLTDSGGSYRSAPVEAWCAARGVLHIFTLPRTPQLDAASEHGMHGLKCSEGLGKGAAVLDLAACAIRGAVLHCPGRGAHRRAIRDALLATLEEFAWIARTRGGRPWRADHTEGVP